MFARAAVGLLAITATSEGAVAYRELSDRAKISSTYSTVCDRIARNVPPGPGCWRCSSGGLAWAIASPIIVRSSCRSRAWIRVPRRSPLHSKQRWHWTRWTSSSSTRRWPTSSARPEIHRGRTPHPLRLEVGEFLKRRAVEVDAFTVYYRRAMPLPTRTRVLAHAALASDCSRAEFRAQLPVSRRSGQSRGCRKLLTLKCRGWGSNPHGACGPSGF